MQQLEPYLEQLTDSKLGKEYCILAPYLFNLYAEYIMQNDGLDESQAGSKIAGRNINNFRSTADTTLMAKKIEEELEPFDEGEKRRVKKASLKLNIQKTKIMASSPITLGLS